MDALKDTTLDAYIGALASGAPAPGGGSAAALAGAQGAALGAMVTELSLGRKKYAEHADMFAAARNALLSLAQELTADIDRDTQAFEAVSAAMKLPKETPQEQAHRSAQMQRALLTATRSPLSICARSAQALDHLHALVGHSNASAASDLGTGAAMLRAAAQGAWLNILINLGGLKDAAQASALLEEGRALYTQALARADDIFSQIETACMPD